MRKRLTEEGENEKPFLLSAAHIRTEWKKNYFYAAIIQSQSIQLGCVLFRQILVNLFGNIEN